LAMGIRALRHGKRRSFEQRHGGLIRVHGRAIGNAMYVWVSLIQLC
jgi:hypothetical protein